MNRLDEDDLPVRGYASRPDPDSGDREISLGTPTILGIFFALALLCACFFGFGYTMGRKSGQAAQSTVSLDPNLSGAPKPAAGSAATQTATRPPQPAAAPTTETATVPLTSPATSNSTITPADRMIVGDKPPAAAAQPATASLQSAASYVVQVAAVSSQDVADILTSSLQKKGYTVAVRHEPQDKLLHVQIGPFTDKKEAQAMQARVLADGFNAIVK